MGGSALAHVFDQVGDEAPDVEDASLLKRAFNVVQELIAAGIVSAGHDRSDGGLITTLLEMAFAGNCGIDIDLRTPTTEDPIAFFFAEELGLVLEVDAEHEAQALSAFVKADVPCAVIGASLEGHEVKVRFNGRDVLNDDVRALRDLWEATSFQLDRLQANPDYVEQERSGLFERSGPKFSVPFEAKPR